MPINVKSEIGTLKKVLLHRPGEELEHLIPNSLERLLFDDIPYLQKAQTEHDEFAAILRDNGCEVCYLEDLTAEVLKSDPSLKDSFIEDVIMNSGDAAIHYKKELTGLLSNIEDEKALVLKTMAGVGFKEIEAGTKGSITQFLSHDDRFVMEPIPNLYFTRDPFATIGSGVSLNKMYSVTRCRETIYGKYILKYHPDFKDSTKFYYDRDLSFHIEGGDVLNLTNKVLACGISQRTQPEAIEQLARNIFSDEEAEIDTVLAFVIPPTRAFMHLDTVFTQVDVDKFTIHPGIMGTLRTFEIKKGSRKNELKVRELSSNLEETLAYYLGVPKVDLIRCGGGNYIAAEREQWNDGSNTLCIAPGKVIVYDRNYITNSLLEDKGVKVLKMPSSELSRGRGGPRCMSMPIVRENIF